MESKIHGCRSFRKGKFQTLKAECLGLIYFQIARAVDEETVTRDLVPAFVKLLKDTEAEVRTAIAGQIPGKGPSKDSLCARS